MGILEKLAAAIVAFYLGTVFITEGFHILLIGALELLALWFAINAVLDIWVELVQAKKEDEESAG